MYISIHNNNKMTYVFTPLKITIYNIFTTPYNIYTKSPAKGLRFYKILRSPLPSRFFIAYNLYVVWDVSLSFRKGCCVVLLMFWAYNSSRSDSSTNRRPKISDRFSARSLINKHYKQSLAYYEKPHLKQLFEPKPRWYTVYFIKD